MGDIIVGIDLGINNSCAVIYRNKQIELFRDENADFLIPTIVAFTEYGILTGTEAKDKAYLHPTTTIHDIDKLIGQNYINNDVQNFIKTISYKVINYKGIPKINIKFLNKTLFPEEIIGLFIKEIKLKIEEYVGQKVNKVVVTVPAYFHQPQIEDIENAAKIAGFRFVRTVNAPIAATMALHFQNPKPNLRNVMVCNFTSSTLEVSIVSVTPESCVLKMTVSEKNFGENDMLENLVNYVMEDYYKKLGVQLNNYFDTVILKGRCKRAIKQFLRPPFTASIESDFLNYKVNIFLAKFDQLNHSFFNKVLETLKNCLVMCKLKKSDIDEVVLVGVSHQIPTLQTLLNNFFSQNKINKTLNPSKCVAYGAILHLTSNKKEENNILVIDVIINEDGNNSDFGQNVQKLTISNNTIMPIQQDYTYVTINDNTSKISITVTHKDFQSEENIVLDRLFLFLTEPGKNIEIHINFKILTSGIMQVGASEQKNCENVAEMEIDVKGLIGWKHLNDGEVYIQRYNKQKVDEFLSVKNNLERLCFKTKTIFKFLPENKKSDLISKCDEILNWLGTVSIDDTYLVKKKLQNLHFSIVMN